MLSLIRGLIVLLAISISWAIAPAITHAAPSSAEIALPPITTHHTVSTQDPITQDLFDRGLQSFYAFDLEQAAQTFQQVADHSPSLAMAYWGIALASSPDVNQPAELSELKVAYEAVQQAQRLAESPQTSAKDKDYIAVLAQRYTLDPKVDLKRLMANYLKGLKDLMQTYPNDPDLATLYAEGLMDLQGWDLWTTDQKPLGNTPEIVATLESVIQQDPDHLGANHYYIHAMEASDHPEVTLTSAQRLKTQAQASNHLEKLVTGILTQSQIEY